jgi:hypothetical protein
MSEMVKRVGRAIELAVKAGQLSDMGTATYQDLGRAAIAAMREPTEKMLIVGNRVQCCEDYETDEIYTGMIDAALDEQGQSSP